MSTVPGPRPFCYRCHKPRLTCICSHLPLVDNRIPVWVIQHPRERFHPLGTARIARLGLRNVRHTVLRRPAGAAPTDLPARAALLYPGPGAVPLERVAGGPLSPSALVVVDGTWAQAHTLHRDHAWLQALPRYALRPAAASRYRIRKEPARDCVSTIEAIVEALTVLEPETAGLTDLLAAFDTMIDNQIALMRRLPAGRGPRAPGQPALDVDRLVVVGGEAAPRSAGGRQALVHWVAARARSGEVFERFVKPPEGCFPSPCHLRDLGLDAEQLATGACPDDVRRDWTAFLHPGERAVAWHQGSLTLLGDTLATPRDVVLLKSLYCSRVRGPCGTLEQLVARLGLMAPPLGLHGRAGRTVGLVLAVLEHLRGAGRHSHLDEVSAAGAGGQPPGARARDLPGQPG